MYTASIALLRNKLARQNAAAQLTEVQILGFITLQKAVEAEMLDPAQTDIEPSKNSKKK